MSHIKRSFVRQFWQAAMSNRAWVLIAVSGVFLLLIGGLALYVRYIGLPAIDWASWKIETALVAWLTVPALLCLAGYRWRERRQKLAMVVAAGIIWAALFLLIFPKYEAGLTGALTLDELKAVSDARRGWALILGGAFVLAGLAVAWWRAKISEQGQITERYTRAIDQLGKVEGGKPVIEVRLGGIYALERIARDSPSDQGQVMEVLCAYVRENAEPGTERRPDEEPESTENKTRSESSTRPREDVQAALTVIGRRKVDRDPAGLRIDLSRTWLHGADFYRSNPENARLEKANFREAHLKRAIFDGAQLKYANFVGAQLERARFYGAQLERARFYGAQLKGANFMGVQLKKASFGGVQLQGASFIGAQLKGASLRAAELNGAGGLTKEQILAAQFDERTIFPDGKSGRTPEMVRNWTDKECQAAGLDDPNIF